MRPLICDGDHGAPACASPTCWQRPPVDPLVYCRTAAAVGDWAQLAAEVALPRWAFPIHVNAQGSHGGAVEIRVHAEVSERDGLSTAVRGALPTWLKTTDITFLYVLHGRDLAGLRPPVCDRATRLAMLRACVQAAVLHEVDEALLVAGERVWDPHRADRPGGAIGFDPRRLYEALPP